MSARAGRLAMLVVAAAALTGCVVLPPPLPTAAPGPVVTPAPQATSAAPEPTQAAPSQSPTEPAPSEPAATDSGNELPPPTLAECTAADEALAAIVTRSSQVLDAVPADGEPDWAAADAVVAELPAMRDAFIASTTSAALAESFRELDEPIASMAEAVASRDDLSVILRSASVALAAPSALLPCAGIL